MQRFLQSLCAEADDDSVGNITWLELYLVYRVSGLPKPIADNPCPGRARVSLEKQFLAFEAPVWKLSDRIFIGFDDKSLFKPATIREPNLIGVPLLR